MEVFENFSLIVAESEFNGTMMKMQDRHALIVANSVVNVLLFLILCLPAAILCGLCLVAVLFAYEINIQMRVILLNIFAAEFSALLVMSIAYLGYPSFALGVHDDDYLCYVLYSMLVTSGLVRLGAATLYAIMVYVFTVSRSSRLKWKVIFPSIVVLWALPILSSQVVYSDDIRVSVGIGICRVGSRAPIYVGFITFWLILGFVYLCVIFSFGLATQVYIRNNILQENGAVKRAVAKNLIYHVIAASMSFASSAIPTIFHLTLFALKGRRVEQHILLYTLRITFSIVSLITPIASICILKPVRDSLKAMFRCLRNHTQLHSEGPLVEGNDAAETPL